MTSSFAHTIAVLLVLCSLQVRAQETPLVDTSVVIVDTLSESFPAEESDDEDFTVNFVEPTAEDRQPVAVRKVAPEKEKEIRKDDAFWYADKTPERKKQREAGEPFFVKLLRQPWVRNLLWALVVGGFICVLIWFVIASDIRLFRRRTPPVAQEDEEIAHTENIFDIDYEREIGKAIGQGNFRMAVRLHYLQVLKWLSVKELIRFRQERTNSEYLLQLYNTDYYREFFRLTRHFEYTWYGQFTLSPAQYDTISEDFAAFKQKLL